MVKPSFRPGRVSFAEGSAKPVEILGWKIPREFSIGFYATSYDAGKAFPSVWEVNLQIHVKEDGTPVAKQLSVLSSLDPPMESGSSATGIKRWQLELIESEFHNLLAQSVQQCISSCEYMGDGEDHFWGFYKWVVDSVDENGVESGWYDLDHEIDLDNVIQELEPKEKKLITKEVQRLTHRRPHDLTHLQKVADIYNREFERATSTGTRPRMIREIMDQMNTNRGTAQMWVRAARDYKPPLIPVELPLTKKNSTPSKSVGKAIPNKTKSTTTPTKKGRK